MKLSLKRVTLLTLSGFLALEFIVIGLNGAPRQTNLSIPANQALEIWTKEVKNNAQGISKLIAKNEALSAVLKESPRLTAQMVALLLSYSIPAVQSCTPAQCLVISYLAPYDVYFYVDVSLSGKGTIEDLDLGAGEALRNQERSSRPLFLRNSGMLEEGARFIRTAKFSRSDIDRLRQVQGDGQAVKAGAGNVETRYPDQWAALKRIEQALLTLDDLLSGEKGLAEFRDCSHESNNTQEWYACMKMSGVSIDFGKASRSHLTGEEIFKFFKTMELVAGYQSEKRFAILCASDQFPGVVYFYPAGLLVNASENGQASD